MLFQDRKAVPSEPRIESGIAPSSKDEYSGLEHATLPALNRATQNKFTISAAVLLAGLSIFGCGKEKQDSNSAPADASQSEVMKDYLAQEVPSFGLISSVEEIRRDSAKTLYSKNVLELEYTSSGLFSYIFTGTGADSSKIWMLRGVSAGKERNDLLSELDTLGYEVSGAFARNPRQPVDSKVQAPPKGLWDWFSSIASLGFMAVMAWYVAKVLRTALKGHSSTSAGTLLEEKSDQRFSDIGGIDQVLDDFRELADDIRAAQQGQKRHELKKATLLYGPPGTGKTMLARALAGEVDCPFIYFSCSALAGEMFIGTGQARVKDSFAQGRKARDNRTKELRKDSKSNGQEEGVCILFLDEFDSIGSERNFNDSVNPTAERDYAATVNALLTELDSVDQGRNKNIVVLAATNEIDAIDPALLRPGRFNKLLEVPLPHTITQRWDILQKLAAKQLEPQGVKVSVENLDYIARVTPGKSGDHLRGILTEARNIAERADRTTIEREDLFEAFQRQEFGRRRPSYSDSQKRELVAVHEHGHGIVALASGIGLFLVSMQARGDTLGRVIPDPEAIAGELPTLRDFMARILIALGGRAAELTEFGPTGVTPGARNDIEQVRAMLRDMFSSGMLAELYSPADTMRDENMRESHILLIDSITARSIEIGRQIIGAVGHETMSTLVKDSLALDRDLVWPDAQDFYESRLGAETIAKIREIVAEFLSHPLGEAGPDAS